MIHSIHYRSEIDGLRAISVLCVIFFHAGLFGFSGGYIGVDVFFVISGYLITKILIKEHEQNQFSYLRFVERRIRRIFPALFFMLLVVGIASYFTLLPSDLKSFGESLTATALFISNVFFWRTTNYFSQASEFILLIHTWSLAVEEQYYIFFPILLAIVWQFGRSTTFWTIAIIAVLSLLLSEWGWRNKSIANFFLSPFRAWEILLGSLAAFGVIQCRGKLQNLLAGAGLVMIIGSAVFFDDYTPTPSVYILLPTVGSVLILLFAQSDTHVGRILSLKPLVGIGLISYSTYLWHQPIFALTRLNVQSDLGITVSIALIFLSIAIGYFSWRYIERPFRNKSLPFLSRRIVFATSLGLILILCVMGVSAIYFKGFPARFDSVITAADNAQLDKNPLRPTCHFSIGERFPKDIGSTLQNCKIGQNDTPQVIILGDSHASAISYQTALSLAELGYTTAQFTISGCLPFLGYSTTQYDCELGNQKVFEYIRSSDIKTVILAGRFVNLIHNKGFNNTEGGVELGAPPKPLYHFETGSGDAFSPEDAERFLEKGLKKWLATDKNIVVVHPIPEAGWNVPKKVISLKLAKEYHGFLGTKSSLFKDRTENLSAMLENIADAKLIHFKPAEYLCDSIRNNQCANSFKDKIFYYDDDHLSNKGAALFSNQLAKTIDELHQSTANQ